MKISWTEKCNGNATIFVNNEPYKYVSLEDGYVIVSNLLPQKNYSIVLKNGNDSTNVDGGGDKNKEENQKKKKIKKFNTMLNFPNPFEDNKKKNNKEEKNKEGKNNKKNDNRRESGLLLKKSQSIDKDKVKGSFTMYVEKYVRGETEM